MKKTIIRILTIIMLIIFLSPISIAMASATNGKYLRVITDNTPFYKSIDEPSPLFCLPYTYYVKLLGTSGNYTYVECYGNGGITALDGYVPTELLFDDGLSVINPYVVLELTTQTTAVLYSDATTKEPLQYLFAERQLKYYGHLNVGEQRIYYVSYNDKLGYIKESDVYPFLIADHPNELTFLPKDNPEIIPDEPINSSEQIFNLKVIITASLIFAGILALIIALKEKPTKKVATSYYDDNDYE